MRQRNDVTRSLRLLQTLRTTPTAKIRATDVLQLPRYDGNIISTEVYFAAKSGSLPPLMREHLELWFQVMLDGCRQAPRQVPRDPQTVRVQMAGLVTVVNNWAEAGCQSFAEVTTADIRDALLPLNPGPRHAAELALRSPFRHLKGRRLIFTDPMRSIKSTPVAGNIPLTLDPAVIREELNHPDPAVALAVALIAFHAPTKSELRNLTLTDIVDGRLAVSDRDVPLAARSGPGSLPGSTTASAAGPTAPTPTCSSADGQPHGSSPSATTSPGRASPCDPKRCARTASCTRSTPPAATYAASATCSGSAWKVPPAT